MPLTQNSKPKTKTQNSMLHSHWESIIQIALRTPSPHNTQPWRLRIKDERHATLYLEVARTLPDEDTTGHFLRCAMGMFLESLRIISANAGFSLAHTLIENSGASGSLFRFAELELQGSSEASPYANELFQTRMTSRLPSNGARIDPELTALLKQTAPEFGQRYDQLDDPVRIEAMILENICAIFHDLNVRAYHDEIARWFRYSDEEARTKADGLDYRCMRVPAIQLKLMREVPQIMRWPLIGDFIRWTYRQQLGKVSHIGIISGPFFEDAAAVRAGAYLMRFWLELARQKLFIHPFGNLVTNPQAKARVHELTGIADVWLVFRIGYTDAPPQSYHRSLNDVLIHD
jgi:nitroreductase